MRQIFKLQTLYWAIYALALFLIYHLIVKIAFLEGSWIALLIFIPLSLVCSLIVKRDDRKAFLVFTIGFLLLDRSLVRLDDNTIASLILGGAFAILVIALIARFYGKVAWNAILALVLVAVGVNASFNRDNLMALSNFYVKWESDRLYNGTWVDYFPTTLYDVDHDGQMEVITYGNAEELPLPEEKVPETDAEKKELAEKQVTLESEPLSLYIFRWDGNKMVRIPTSAVAEADLARIKEQMPVDYPGFPFYKMKDNQMVANVQRQPYTEAMLQTGTGPHRSFLLDMGNIDHLLTLNHGAMDQRQSFQKPSKFQNILIKDGILSGTYDTQPFQTPTDATKILDTMKLIDGREGLIVLGEHLAVLVSANGGMEEVYSLNRKQVNGLATSEVIVADIDHDQADELLIANTPSYILKPTAQGTFEILWVSKNTENDLDKSFRFSNFATIGNEAKPEIVAKAKSWVSEHERRYLTGYQYTPEGLEQTWRIYLPLINVQVGNIDGDQENEIIATIHNSHQLLVFERHQIPVLPIVIAIFVALVGYGVVRRFRHA
ncbi:hypothetical protein [Brevibacillus sp. SYSU BS000544]|uniref:hypothetical protein n=1 Tax=Brevibacillus sp. SYSU BS000544 TaxID=3416443 RepID=UPI003CE527B2